MMIRALRVMVAAAAFGACGGEVVPPDEPAPPRAPDVAAPADQGGAPGQSVGPAPIDAAPIPVEAGADEGAPIDAAPTADAAGVPPDVGGPPDGPTVPDGPSSPPPGCRRGDEAAAHGTPCGCDEDCVRGDL